MKILFLVIIFLAELAWSFFADYALVSVVGRKPLEACLYNIGSQVVAYEVLRLIAKRGWSRIYIYVAIGGSTVGTFLVAIRG